MDVIIDAYYVYRGIKQVWQLQKDVRGGYSWFVQKCTKKTTPPDYDDAHFIIVNPQDSVVKHNSCNHSSSIL